ncbi:MAG: phosphoadenosine phosphosulfate reductase family protein [Saprospiraceae bacterium]|nr:phosphoadenosine phosphosulfate reductase family protein [Saprospiraceae bacterium]
MDIEQINLDLADKSPEDIIQWALANSSNPLVTTNFRPYESAILHATCKLKKDLKVVWCDTGYNTPDTYRHAKELIGLLEMNMHVYVPKYSAGFRDVLMGIPEVDTDAHNTFTTQVKLEPFRRAIEEHKPDLWFTNLRKGQTAFRNSIDIVSKGKDGTIKVSPFYHYSDAELDEYLALHNLPNEFNYFDPTKQLASRECGLHN